MHLSQEDAISILESWRQEGTSLRIYFSQSGANRDFQASIGALTISAMELVSTFEILHVELDGAEFNGGKDAAASSNYSAYLVCECRNGDRCYFYVPRGKPGSGQLTY
jgi:hypothetical protein